MKKIFFNMIILLLVKNFYTEDKHTIWGDAGYILKLNRIAEEKEGAIPGKEDKNATEEIERWLFNHLVYISFNYRYSNIFELGTDFSIILDDLEKNTINSIIQELSCKVSPADWVMFKFGKQKLKWGVSNVFHPIDKLEVYSDALAVRQVVEGLAGIKVTFIPFEWFSISAVILPELQMRYTRYALRFDFTLPGEVDLGIGGIKYDIKHMYDIDDGDILTERLDRGAFFIDLVKYFGNFGLYSEFEFRYSRENEYSFIDDTGEFQLYTNNNFEKTPVFRVTGGINYKMRNKPFMNVALEYFFNSEGFNSQEAKDFYSRYKYHEKYYSKDEMVLPFQFDNFGNFRRHYLYLGLTGIEPINFFSLDFTLLANLETASFIFTHGFTFNINKSIYIGLSHDFYFQFTNKDEYPSELNFNKANHVITLEVSTSYKK